MVADILQESKDAQYVLDIDEMSSLLLGTSQNVLRIEIVILPTDDLFHRGGWINHHLDIHFSGVQTMIIYGNISEALLVSWWVWLTSWRSCGYHLRWENGQIAESAGATDKDGELTKRGFQGKIVIILPLFFHRGLYDRCGLEDSNFKK